MELKNSVAIVTGASRGIGALLATGLAERGTDVALAARSAEDLEGVAERARAAGARVITVPTDVTARDDLQRLVERTNEELGPVDLLVNNAGIERYVRFHEADLDDISAILTTNLVAAEWLSRLVLPQMIARRHGHIVNMASVAGKTAVPFNTVYSSSKHGLVGFSWSLREEVKRHDIGVSAICPGFVSDTGMFHDWSQGERPPGLTRTVAPEKVVAKTLWAIEKNKAEVIVAPGLLKVVDVLHAASPALTTSLARLSGGYRFLEERGLKAWAAKD